MNIGPGVSPTASSSEIRVGVDRSSRHVAHPFFAQVSGNYRPARTLQILFLAKVINCSTDYMHESIAKEGTRRSLLANEDSRETIIKAEQLGSALSDDVVSPIIRRVNYQLCKTDRISSPTQSWNCYIHYTRRGQGSISPPEDTIFWNCYGRAQHF